MKKKNQKTCTINGVDEIFVTVMEKKETIHLLKVVGENALMIGIHYPGGVGAEYFGTATLHFGTKAVPSIRRARQMLGF